jgi:hypothetical protein
VDLCRLRVTGDEPFALETCYLPAEEFFRIRQVIYSSKGKATIYGVGFYRSERHTLFIRRFARTFPSIRRLAILKMSAVRKKQVSARSVPGNSGSQA